MLDSDRSDLVGWAHRLSEQRRSWVGKGGGACERVRACVRDVFAIYDNDILPRLIMIILKLLSYISYKSDTLMISPKRVPV